MGDGPKRFSLSDYQSKHGHAKPMEASVPQEQRNELEELQMLLGTGAGSNDAQSNDGVTSGILRTPGVSPVRGDRENGKVGGGHDDTDIKAEHSGRYGDKRGTKDSRSKKHSSSRRHRHGRSRRSGRRSRSPRSRSRSHSRSRSRAKRAQARSASQSRSRSRSSSGSRSRSRSRGRNRSKGRRRGRSHRSDRHRSSHRHHSRSRSQSKDKISMRCVFPYEDGGIIIGLRGAHLSKLRRAIPAVDWRISNETSDRQDRILVVRGTVDDVAEAFKELSEHFISQGMHIDYPLQSRSHDSKEVDTDKPFVPIRLLIPHKTCGAIIGQKSETLINTRISCAARRVYVYRERISNSRERIVEIVGTPRAVSRVMKVLGGQIGRTLSSDQRESDPYVPERDGLRKFLSKQGVPRTRVGLESLKPSSEKNAAGTTSDSKKNSASKKRRNRSRSASLSRSPSSDQSRSRSRSRGEEHRHRSSRRRKRLPRSVSTSRSRSPSKAQNRRDSRRKHKNRSRSGKSESGRHKSKRRGESVGSSRGGSHSRNRSKASNQNRSRSRKKEEGGNAQDSGSVRAESKRNSKRDSSLQGEEQRVQDGDADMYDSNEEVEEPADSGSYYSEDGEEAPETAIDPQQGDVHAQPSDWNNRESADSLFFIENKIGADQSSFQGGSW